MDLTARAGAGDPSLVLEAARANLAAARPALARALLNASAPVAEGPVAEILRGEAALALGRAEGAARHFAAARRALDGDAAARLAVREGLAWEAAGQVDAAAAAFHAARRQLPEVAGWLRLREARVTRDTTAAQDLLDGLPEWMAGRASAARITARILAGDSIGALREARAAGHRATAARLALALGDVAGGRADLYTVLGAGAGPEQASLAELALRAAPPRRPAEHVRVARALRAGRRSQEALAQVRAALSAGDSSASTLLLWGELLAERGQHLEAARAFQVAEVAGGGSGAALRRARALLRGGSGSAPMALRSVADRYPRSDEGATALFLLGDIAQDNGRSGEARGIFVEVVTRFPESGRASLARLRLAGLAWTAGDLEGARRWYTREVASAGAHGLAARYWMGRVARERGDEESARRQWSRLVQEDSLGYYGLLARAQLGLGALAVPRAPVAARDGEAREFLDRLTLLLELGLVGEALDEVRSLLERPPADPDRSLTYAEGLIARGYTREGIRLGWHAARVLTLHHPRVLRVIYPWPRRTVIELEAQEFGLDPFLLAAVVRQESAFDTAAVSRAGARGLMQLMPATAAEAARELRLAWHPDWVMVPDLNLHLGVAHLADLLRAFDGSLAAALGAYNAGSSPVRRWVRFNESQDLELWIERIPYAETRAYVRSVLRNVELYRALYGA